MKTTSRYYYQIQTQMFAVQVEQYHFVVWTCKEIFFYQVHHDPLLIKEICLKLGGEIAILYY